MAVNLTNADNALKTYYLDVVKDKLNYSVNPFLAAIKHCTDDVYGKEVRKLVVHGVNGGIGAGTEDGALPTSGGNNYSQIVTTLKNIYGTIEISDKAIRASENNAGSFVSLLNAEMEGLIASSTYNFGRMLFGDGSGVLTKVITTSGDGFMPEDMSTLKVGMVIDIINPSGEVTVKSKRIKKILENDNIVILEGIVLNDTLVPTGSSITIQGSYNNEITGLKGLLDNVGFLYGLPRLENAWLMPYTLNCPNTFDEMTIQKALDEIEKQSGGSVNFIVCSWGVRRTLIKLFSANNSNVKPMELAGGFKGISYNGIPIVADRFCPAGTMYLLNTDDFSLNQLCDWQWMEGDDGRVLRQVPGKPVYTATLVKYAELVCSRPNGQGVITGIKEN